MPDFPRPFLGADGRPLQRSGSTDKERQNAQQLEELLQQNSGESQIPPEVYELMAAVINFAQDMNEEWLRTSFGRP